MDNPKVITRYLQHAAQNPDENVRLYPTRNLNEVHFSVRGPKNTIFEGGWYHGEILLPREYPYKPPNVRLLTRSGRFEVNTNLCFSFTAFHPETWSPAVNLTAIVIALQSLFDAWDERAVGMISNCSRPEIKLCVAASRKYSCEKCGCKHSELAWYCAHDRVCCRFSKMLFSLPNSMDIL